MRAIWVLDFVKVLNYSRVLKLIPTHKGISSASIGKPGASLNIGKKGTRTSVGIPGTGLSYSKHQPYSKRPVFHNRHR